MSESVFVKPADPALSILMDDGKRLPPEGREVALTRFVRRRLADGSIVEASPDAEDGEEG